MAENTRSSIGVRVRPNADRFIIDLGAQLKSKKYTFYVDVAAKTNQATSDVRAWANSTLKSIDAKVLVGANTALATGDMSRWRARQKAIKTLIPITANVLEANREVEAWRKIAGRDLTIRVRADVTGRLTEIERVRRAAEKEARLTVRGDTSKIKSDIKSGIDAAGQGSLFSVEIDADTKKARLAANDFYSDYDNRQLTLDLDIDTTAAAAQIEAFDSAVKSKPLTQKAKVDLEAAEFRRDLAKLRLEAFAKKMVVEAEVKVRNIDRVTKQLNALEKRFGSATVIRSLDFGPINLGQPTGLIGTLTTITALAGLIPGVVTGFAALSDVLVRVAGAASVLPGLLAGIGASFGTLKVGMFGFSDALDAMFKVWTEPTDKIERTQRNTIKWTNDLSRALDDEKKAQRAVGDARRDATNELRNLNNELRGSVLNEAQALLDLQRAKDRYAQGDFENQTEAVQAQLDIAKAEQNVIDVRERNTQLYQKASQKQAQGVEQSDQVTAAMEDQARATEAVALAMQSIAMANPMGAQSLFEDAMDRLSPKARAAVEAIGGLRSEITEFQRGLQDVMFDGVADQITGTFENLGPTIMPGMNAIAQGLNQNILAIFAALNSPDGKSIIERILGGTAEAQRMLSAVIDPLIRGFGTLMAAGAEHLPQLVGLIGTLVDRFALFIEKADQNGSLDKFMSDGIVALGNLVQLAVNAMKIINDFGNAFKSAFGTDLLTRMVQITDKWHQFLSSEEGQKRLNKYIEKARDIFNEWKPVLEKLPGIFEKVSNVATKFLEGFLPLLERVLGFLEKFPGLVELFAGMWIGGKMFSAGKALFDFGKILFGLGKGIANITTKAMGFFRGLAPFLPVLGPLFQGGMTVLPPFLPGQKPVIAPGPGGTAAAAGGAGGANAKPQGRLGKIAGALGKFGKVFAPLSIGLLAFDLFSNASDAGNAYTQWQQARNEAPNEASRRDVDREIYASINIDIGESGDYPILSEFDFKSFVNPPDPMRGIYDAGFTVKGGKIVSNQDGQEYGNFGGSYAKGGFTPWAKGEGRGAVLHGQEFVLPADAVSFYGKDLMEAMRQRQLPPGMLKGFSDGGEAEGPMVYDPTTGTYGPAPTSGTPHMPTQTKAEQPNPQPGILPSIAQGAAEIASNAANQAAPYTGGIYNPGTTSTNMYNPLGGPTGALPGPAPVPSIADIPITTDVAGMPVQVTAMPAGWPGGQAPIGLGGGPDGFDMRRFGFGPGPAGSSPSDWVKWTADFASGALQQLGTSLLGGFLGIFGLEGILDNNYVRSGLGLADHFFGAGSDSKIQAPGADETNAAALGYINTYNNMPMNPAYPGVPGGLPPELAAQFPGYGVQFMPGAPGTMMGMPGMPGMPGYIPGGTPLPKGGAAGSESGLRSTTIGGRRALSAAFPFLREIGGYREDALRWHPNGLALDAMIPQELQFTAPGYAIGDAITSWAIQNANGLGVDHVIWNKKQYFADGRVESIPSKGDRTQNHEDHPHIVFKESPYPTKDTQYRAPAAGIMQFGLNQQGYPVAIAGGGYTPMTMPGMGGGSGGAETVSGPGTNDSPFDPLGSAASEIPTYIFSGGQMIEVTNLPGKKIRATIPGMSAKGTIGGAPGFGSTTGRQPGPETLKFQAKTIAMAAGMSENNYQELEQIIQDLSNWNPNKRTGSPSGRGDRLGLGQIWSATREKLGILNELDGLKQFRAILQLIKANGDFEKAVQAARTNKGFARGGAVWGEGSAKSDSIPAMLSNGEHVLTAEEVQRMGGQNKVYQFREMLKTNRLPEMFAAGGAAINTGEDASGNRIWEIPLPPSESDYQAQLDTGTGIGSPQYFEERMGHPGNFNPGVAIDTSNAVSTGTAKPIPKIEYWVDRYKNAYTNLPKMYLENLGIMEHPQIVDAPPIQIGGGTTGFIQTGSFANGGAVERNRNAGRFAIGGAVRGMVQPPKPPAPTPPPPARKPMVEAKKMIEPARQKVVPEPPKPQFAPPSLQQMPPMEQVPQGTGEAPPPTTNPQGSETTSQASEYLQSTGPGAGAQHLHPAMQKGIQGGFAAVGNIVNMAVQAAAAGATMGASAAAGAGGMGAGGGGSMISGLFQQGGKIATSAANIGASFLVGSLTGGTTKNAYGATQVANQPRGGTKIYDASTQIGSIQTSDLDEYYRRENRRQAQRAQSNLGQWGSR